MSRGIFLSQKRSARDEPPDSEPGAAPARQRRAAGASASAFAGINGSVPR